MKKSHILIIIIILLLIVIMAYLSTNKTEEQIPKNYTLEIPKDKETCEENSGKWGIHHLEQIESCILPASDSGKTCTDSSQCESKCIASEPESNDGKCYSWKPIPGGCYYFIESGTSEKTQTCVD